MTVLDLQQDANVTRLPHCQISAARSSAHLGAQQDEKCVINNPGSGHIRRQKPSFLVSISQGLTFHMQLGCSKPGSELGLHNGDLTEVMESWPFGAHQKHPAT